MRALQTQALRVGISTISESVMYPMHPAKNRGILSNSSSLITPTLNLGIYDLSLADLLCLEPGKGLIKILQAHNTGTIRHKYLFILR
jgi:hypothetical protein